jgi:ankyrin repeat protein
MQAACARGQVEAVRALLDARANPAIRDPNGWTALFEACRGGHDKIVDMMVEQGMRWVGVRKIQQLLLVLMLARCVC